MAGLRRAIELAIGEEDLARLVSIARSRTEPASRVERARMLLAYRKDPSFFAVGRALGVHHQTVERCVERALAYGPMAALDDRPRPGKEPTIPGEARTWLVSLACRKAKDLGYPHELWTTRLLARHAREHGPAEGHACLGKLVQGTLCKILNEQQVKPQMCAPTWNAATPSSKPRWRNFCASTARSRSSKRPRPHRRRRRAMRWRSSPMTRNPASSDRHDRPGSAAQARRATARDHEYRNGTVSLLSVIDLITGAVHALAKIATHPRIPRIL